ncbi:hypothetical protein FVP47_11810, partial [Mycobacterium tuberculosis]|nr:hypothetical protein [Mycobacterium tuberculosis]
TTVWNAVVSELNGDPKVDDGPSSDANLSAPLTPQQRAWLNLVVVGCGVWRCGSRIFGRRHGSVVGFVGRRRSDADPELDL